MPETLKNILSLPEFRNQRNIRNFLIASILIVVMYVTLVIMYLYSASEDVSMTEPNNNVDQYYGVQDVEDVFIKASNGKIQKEPNHNKTNNTIEKFNRTDISKTLDNNMDKLNIIDNNENNNIENKRKTIPNKS